MLDALMIAPAFAQPPLGANRKRSSEFLGTARDAMFVIRAAVPAIAHYGDSAFIGVVRVECTERDRRGKCDAISATRRRRGRRFGSVPRRCVPAVLTGR